jgi:hypothetical protein
MQIEKLLRCPFHIANGYRICAAWVAGVIISLDPQEDCWHNLMISTPPSNLDPLSSLLSPLSSLLPTLSSFIHSSPPLISLHLSPILSPFFPLSSFLSPLASSRPSAARRRARRGRTLRLAAISATHLEQEGGTNIWQSIKILIPRVFVWLVV